MALYITTAIAVVAIAIAIYYASEWRECEKSKKRWKALHLRTEGAVTRLDKKLEEAKAEIEIEHDKTVRREYIIRKRDAEIKDLQTKLDEAQAQIADLEAKAVKPKPVKTVKPLDGYVRCPKCFGVGVVPKDENPAPVTSKPKPLLADAEVGDEVVLRNGNIGLIIDTHNRSQWGDYPVRCKSGIIYSLSGKRLSLNPNPGDLDIVRLMKKPKTEPQPDPQPEHRCLKCKRFVKNGMSYCDRCFDKVAGIKAEVAK